MINPRCIRIFFSKKEAQNAKKVFSDGGFECYITEDMFEKLRLPDLGMLPRYRLYIDKMDIKKSAEYLKKIKTEEIEG